MQSMWYRGRHYVDIKLVFVGFVCGVLLMFAIVSVLIMLS